MVGPIDDSGSERRRSGRGEQRRARDTAPEGKTASPARIIATALAAILLAVQVARLTLASHFAETDAERAFGLAPDSPDALAAMAMASIGRAAASGEDPDETTMTRLRSLATAAPLRTEPYLVKAALAERAGNLELAEQLFLKARALDPRSTPARYLLANVWLKQDKVAPAIGEVALLSRLMPSASPQLVPALADFARTPGAVERLSAILASNPKLRTPLLTTLAANPDDADVIVALAGPELRSNKTEALLWKSRLLKGLVDRGQYERAHALWRRFVGTDDRQLLFNGEFRKIAAPEPFGWKFSSGSAGLAEPENGTLRVLYYGRDNVTLASQLLLLGPGTYAFAAPLKGNASESALHWRLTCAAGRNQIMELDATARPPAARFAVPANCPAQLLELVGTGAETPKDSDVHVGPVQIARAGA